MMKVLLLASAVIFILLLINAILDIIFKPTSTSTSKHKKKVALETISHIWDKRKETVVAIEELAQIWRENVVEVKEKKDERISFSHPELQEFYTSHIEGRVFFTGNVKKVISEIMKLLDTEGDCPSVVNTKGEPEASIDKNAYGILSEVSLLHHSIHVAEEMIRIISSGPMTPKAIITALGHDIGKIPSYRQKLYSLGDHPLISVTVLEGIEGFKDLSYKEEIMKAIKDHHRTPKGLLAEKLKEADQNSRRFEMSRNINSIDVTHSADDKQTSETHHPPEVVQPNETDIFGRGEDEKQKKEVRIKEVPLSWFDPEEYINELKPHINRLNGGRWDAFSMPNGVVYFNVKAMWEVLKAIARRKQISDVLLADADEEARRNILYSAINILKTEKDAIERGLIRDGYFAAPFIVRMRNGQEYNTLYTPFNVEVFGELVSELEAKKAGKLKEIVDVSPRYE